MPTSGCTVTLKPSDDLAAALERADDGAVLCLEPGTYAAPIVPARNVTVRAARPGKGEVRLDAGGRGPVLVASEPARIVLEDLVLSGGRHREAGGGVFADGGADVLLRGVTITGSKGGRFGGAGVYARQARVVLESCRISGNVSPARAAAVLATGASEVQITGSLVQGNTAAEGGVLEAHDGASITLVAVTVAGNDAPAAIALRGTTTRAPGLAIRASILSQPGRSLVLGLDGSPAPEVEVSESVLDGDAGGVSGEGNVTAPAGLSTGAGDDAFRPGPKSPAKELVHTKGAGYPATDLSGRARPARPSAGCFE